MYQRGGDSLQHQLGWMAFRSEPWSFQLGTIRSLDYPYGTSIVYSDSVPLAALFFKLFSSILPLHFQYFGFWTLLCWILTVFFTMLILREFGLSFPVQALSGILLSLTPTLIDRVFFHDALCAQWLILAAIYLTIRQVHGSYQPWKWVLLVVGSAFIHAYLFFMVGMFFFASLVHEGLTHKQWGRVLLPFAAAVVLTLAGAWTLGMFNVPPQTDNRPIDYYSFNLGSFINGDHSSNLIVTQKYAIDGQYEGFAFLGVGNLLLMLFIVPALIIHGLNGHSLRTYLPLILPAAVLLLLSLGNSLTFDRHHILTIPFPDILQRFYGTFRSIGRFVWPFYYLFILAVLIYAGKKLPGMPVLLILVILAQYFDLQPLITSKAYTAVADYQNPLSGVFWTEAPKTYQHIEIIPQKEMKWANYSADAIYAVENHLTINWVYLARSDVNHLQRDIDAAKTTMLSGGILDPKTIYITDDADFVHSLAKAGNPSLSICRQDDFWYVISMVDMPAELTQSLHGCQIGSAVP
jgi:hypothetical protein